MERDEAYSVLSELIFKGFLVAELNLAGESFIFKTINNRELDAIRILSGNPNSVNYTARFNAYYLAFSLLVADGENFLYNRKERIRDLYTKFIDIPAVLFKNILDKVSKIRTDSVLAVNYLEGFCYTSKSRRMWKTTGGILPSRHFLTGLMGTSELGLNVFQESWMLINRSLDSEEDYNIRFSTALLVASAMNPKGSRRIRNQHQGQVRQVEERRQKLAREGFIDDRKWKPEGWAAPVDTVEELVAELDRQMKGVKDKHDVFIENYMQKLKDETEKKAREVENRIRRAREDLEDIYITSTQRQLSVEETFKMIENRKRRTTVKAGSEFATSEEEKQRFLNKVSGRVLTARRS